MPNITDIRIAANSGALSVIPTEINLPAYPSGEGTSFTISKESTLMSVNGISLGDGKDIFVGSTGSEDKILQFRSLIEGSGITISDPDGETLVISASGSLSVDLNTATGILPISKGGTGINNTIYNAVMLGGADKVRFLPPPITTTNQLLIWDTSINSHRWADIPVATVSNNTTAKLLSSSDNIIKITSNTTDDILSINQANISINNLNGALLLSKGGTGVTSFSNNTILLGNTSSIKELQPSTGFLKYDAATGNYSWANAGVVSITMASPSTDFIITNPTITSSGVIGINLSDTGVIAGIYNNPTLTVDFKGRISNISNGTSSVTIGSNLGTIGEGIYSGNNSNTMQFKRLTVEPTLTIISNPELIKIGVGVIPISNGGTGMTSVGTTGQSLRVNSARTGFEYYTPTNAGGSVTSVGLSAGSNKLIISNSPITSAGSMTVDVIENNLSLSNIGGVLPISKGGTGLTSTMNNSILVGTATGFRLLAPPATPSTLNYTNGELQWGIANQSVAIPSNLVTVHTFTMHYNQSSLVPATIDDLPNGWSYIISGQDVIIVHTVGQPPIFLTMMGLDTAASPNVFKIMYPTSTNPMTIPEQVTGSKELSLTQFKFRATTSATGATTGAGPSIAKVRVTF